MRDGIAVLGRVWKKDKSGDVAKTFGTSFEAGQSFTCN